MINRLANLTAACLISAFLAPSASADSMDDWARRIAIQTGAFLDSSSSFHGDVLSGKRIVLVVAPTKVLTAAAGIQHGVPWQFPSGRMGKMETPRFVFNARGLRSLLEILRKPGSKKESSKKTLFRDMKSKYYAASTCDGTLEPCQSGYGYIPPTVVQDLNDLYLFGITSPPCCTGPGFGLMHEFNAEGGRR